ncbi:hypothetical protein G9A89_004726 [Geosiphon pyriformis]|nr:hypothetical protein G9A89_004726 [Geosiphon pyriformis]
MWNDISGKGETYDKLCQYIILISNWVRKRTSIETVWRKAVKWLNKCPHNNDKIWQMALTKIKEALPEEIKTIKNNPIELDWSPNPNIVLEPMDPEQFHDSSFIQNGNKNNNDLYSDSNPKTYIAFSDLSKKQELKWFSNNNEDIMPEQAHNTNAGFDLRYPGKDVIKLEPYSCTCIDLKVALEIPATTMVQLASRSSLAKKEINIKRGIIDAEYVENIIAMLQNNSEKAYIIEPNKKITQTIFLSLIKIVQLILMENRKKLGITAKEIQSFEFMNRIDVLVNMAEEKIIDKGEIISICQSIFILPYD